MGRPPKFSNDVMLDGALAAIVEHRADATVADIARLTRAPVGSIYHRFPSREHLFVTLWLRSVRAFHEGLLATERRDDPREALLEQAVHIPRFCRERLAEALAMTLYRQSELAADPPAGLEAEVAGVNAEVDALGAQLGHRLYGRDDEAVRLRVRLAVRQCPYGLVRPFVRAQVPLPGVMEDACRAAAAAILDLGSPAPGRTDGGRGCGCAETD